MPVALSPKCQRRFTKLSLQGSGGGYSRNLVCRGQECCSATHKSYMFQNVNCAEVEKHYLRGFFTISQENEDQSMPTNNSPSSSLTYSSCPLYLVWMDPLPVQGKMLSSLFLPHLDFQTTKYVHATWDKKQVCGGSQKVQWYTLQSNMAFVFSSKGSMILLATIFYWPKILPTIQALNENSSSHYSLLSLQTCSLVIQTNIISSKIVLSLPLTVPLTIPWGHSSF